MPDAPSKPDGGDRHPSAARPTRAILGRYRVIETNDEGGFGTVNICWDRRLQRRVAIKQIPMRATDGPTMTASTREEALSEARTACLLGHPNIIQVFDFESDADDSYIVMEYVDGLSLAELLSRVEGGVLTFDECSHVLASVSSALAYAHENGVLHLDIKPANIMVDRTGTVKLADFGMATLASAAGYGGARGGTIGYMSPEQIRGETVDERSDVFSLAVVVYQALTGISPFAAETAQESLRRIERGPRPALSSVEPALAGMVEETLLRGLDPDPANRMASVKDFAHDIMAFLGDQAEGRRSLSDLVSQSESDGGEDDEVPPMEHVPLLERAPWLPSVTVRAVTALCAVVASRSLVRLLTPDVAALALAALGVLAFVWPPLGAAAPLLCLVVLLGGQTAAAAFPLALGIGVVGAVWWIVVGRKEWLASAALLLPAAMPCPYAGTFVAGYALDVPQAFCTGALSFCSGSILADAASYGFDAQALARTVRGSLVSPSFWVCLLCAGMAAFVCSLLSHRERSVARVTGEALCLLIGLLPLLATRMENGSILGERPAVELALAIMSCVTMCVVTVLVGPRERDQEGEENP